MNKHSKKRIILNEIKIIFQFVILGLFLWALYYSLTSERRSKRKQIEICEKYKNQEFSGIVDSVIEKVKCDCFTLQSDSHEYYAWGWVLRYNNRLEKGDSIVKQRGVSKYIIFKKKYKDSVLVLPFDCYNSK